MRKLLLVALFACRAPAPKVESKVLVVPKTRAHAGYIRGAHEIPLGTNATAKVGDYRLWNEEVELVFDALGGKQGFAATGGNLIDARLRPSGVDAINQTFIYLDDTFPRQAAWTNAVLDELPDGTATLTTTGADTYTPTLWIESRHTLRAHGSVLTMRTTVKNTGSAAVLAYELGDCLQWGKTEHFAAGTGFDMHSKRMELPWVAGLGEGVSYGVFPRQGPMSSFSGTSWTDVIYKRADIAPGESVTYERDFVVGSGDVTSVLAASGHVETHVVSGFIRQSNGQPVAGGELLFNQNDQPFATTTALPGGYFEAALPKGAYDVRVSGLGLRSKVREAIDVKGELTHDFAVDSGGTVKIAVTEGGRPTTAKVSVYGVHETKNPFLGKYYLAGGAGNVAMFKGGVGEVKLPPGRYQVFASRGIEYDIAEREIEVSSDAVIDAHFELHHVVDTTAYLSADLHQHQRNSFDSAVSLEDRAIANVAEGLDIIVPTDHDFVTDYRPVIEQMGVDLLTISGAEATTHTYGHYAAYPMTPRPDLPRNGAPETWNRKPPEILADLRAAEPLDKVIQINHPRAEMTGYFDLLHVDGAKFDEGFSTEFDAIEVMNGKRIKEAERVMADWAWFIEHGKRVTATGNSDSHQIIYQEVGYPRNFIRLDRAEFSQQRFVDAVKRQHAVIVTNGPFIELFAGKAQVGDTVRTKANEVTLSYRVQAAPWVDVKTVELWQDGKKVHEATVPASQKVLRIEGSAKLKLPKSSYVYAVVRGEKPLEPVLPTLRNKPTLPYGFTNPIYFEK